MEQHTINCIITKTKNIMSKKQKQIYVHETETLSESNGEIYFTGEFGEIVWNAETLFMDLPHIVNLVYKSREATDKRIREQIEEITRLVTI